MYGLSLKIERIDPIAIVRDDYVSNYMSDELRRLNDSYALCVHCQDGGYVRAATNTVEASYMDWDNQVHTYSSRVCDRHMIDEVENYRDLGK